MEDRLTITQLNFKEMQLFSKYYGVKELEKNETFWDDAFKAYSPDCEVALPLAYNPLSVRLALENLNCTAGDCGACCSYPYIYIKKSDIDRILASGLVGVGELDSLIKRDKDNALYFDGTKGCPMLENYSCRIYHVRPDVCYLFPLQSPQKTVFAGKELKQTVVRIRCRPAFDMVRFIISNAVKETGGTLLPNLQIINGG